MEAVQIQMARLDSQVEEIPPPLPPKASSLMKELPSRIARTATMANNFNRRKTSVVPSKTAALHRRQGFKLKSRVMRRIEEMDQADGGLEVHNPEFDEVDESTFLYESVDFKAVPLPMSKRRQFRDSLKLKGITDVPHWKKALLLINAIWGNFYTNLKDFFHNLKPWKGDLKEVEGQFGSGVASYFSFLRWLVFLNLFIFVLEFGFVVLPTVIICDAELPVNNTLNVSGCGYVRAPSNVTTNVTSEDSSALHDVLNFFTGEGWMRKTLMFYGNYPSKELESTEGVRYDLPLAYLLTGGAYFIFSFFLMITNLMSNLKESYIESDGIFNSFANKVFAVWDFCISEDNAAEHKHDVFVQEVNSDIAEEERQQRIKKRTMKEKTILYTVRVVINVMIVPAVWLSTFFLMFIAILNQDPVQSSQQSKLEHLIERYGYDFLIALAITVPNLILPLFFEFLSIFEDWSRDIELALNLWRRVFVKLPPIAILMFMQFKKINENIHELKQDGEPACNTCWENDVSSQMYMLVWVDFVVVVMTTLGLETLRKVFYQKCKCFRKIGMQQFDIPRNVLDLVYGQSLILIGTFFNPLLPAMAVVKLIILFYVKKVSLMYNNTLPDRPYQSAKSNFTFTLLLLLCFFMCMAVVGWSVTRLPASACGPFSNNACDLKETIFGRLLWEIKQWPPLIHEAIYLMGTAAVIIPVLILFVTCLYYYRSIARANRVIIKMLKKHLAFEAKIQRSLVKKFEAQIEKHNCTDHVN